MALVPKAPRSQKGAALIETIVVSPLLLFLVLLTAEITNAFVDHNTLTKSARNGIRYLAANAVAGTTGIVQITPQVEIETRNLVVFGNSTGAGSPVLPGLAIGNVQVMDLGENNVQVTVTYAYSGLLGATLPSFGIGGDPNLGVNLQATATMRTL